MYTLFQTLSVICTRKFNVGVLLPVFDIVACTVPERLAFLLLTELQQVFLARRRV